MTSTFETWQDLKFNVLYVVVRRKGWGVSEIYVRMNYSRQTNQKFSLTPKYSHFVLELQASCSAQRKITSQFFTSGTQRRVVTRNKITHKTEMKPHHRRAAGALQLYVTPLSEWMPSISHWARHSFTVERNILFEYYLCYVYPN